jgi:hypothetical protein
MNNVNLKVVRTNESDLKRVIEPLASYICATDQPRAALRSALAVLFSEVQVTDWVATVHLAAMSKLAGEGIGLAG